MRRPSTFGHKIKQGIRINFNYYLQRQTPVLVYSTGRVGSMALHASLEKRGILALQVQELIAGEIEKGHHPGTTRWAFHHVIKSKRPAKIISLVREPIEFVIADFFPKLRWISGLNNAPSQLSLDELIHLFNTRYFEQKRHLAKLSWFDTQMKPALGINVYNHPFDREAGYVRFQHPPYDVLIVRTEMPDADKNRIVGEFVGIQDLQIIRLNDGEKRAYGPIYKAFKAQVRIPEVYLDEIINSQYAKHFLTEEERQQGKARWLLPEHNEVRPI